MFGIRILPGNLGSVNYNIPYYFPKESAPPVAGHSPLLVIDQNDKPVCNLALKVAPERLMDVKPGEIQLVIERDYRPPVLASMLKAAHLTMFHVMGYDHVFRSCGLFLADILKQFYVQNRGSHNVSDEIIDRHFRHYENMISPLFVENDNWYQEAIVDRMFLALLTGNGEVFALGVIVRAGTDRFCVFLPTDCCINTYFTSSMSRQSQYGRRPFAFGHRRMETRGHGKWT